MHNSFMDNMQKVIESETPNVSITENGAIGLKTTGNALVDLNFKLSSMRNMSDQAIWSEFRNAYNENRALAIVWLFFARDIRGGCGERRVFRVIFKHVVESNIDIAKELLDLVPEYGRWDDLVWLYSNTSMLKIKTMISAMLHIQLIHDLNTCDTPNGPTLLAKWLPSINTSSKNTRDVANQLRTDFCMTPKEYRTSLAKLRKRIGVVERKMSANRWGDIKYSAVPSKAGMIYRDAFMEHDPVGYAKYLDYVSAGKTKMNAGALFPYEIVHAYMQDWSCVSCKPFDQTLELKWKNLPDIEGNDSTLVVVDGSGSMSVRLNDSTISAHDVARSLGIYFSERLKGQFKDSFITFSSNPNIVKFVGVKTLRDKIEMCAVHNDYSNTNIERTFDLILTTAITNHMKQEEIPTNILIVSDMEFDGATDKRTDKALFDAIAEKWNEHGYKLPRLVFWNVNSRTHTVPLKENSLGIALVSGFSPNIASMVFSGELNPYKIIVNTLNSDRYAPVRKVVGLS